MNVREMQNGSFICDEDPGEVATGKPRISITSEEGKLLGFLVAMKRVLELGTGLGVSTDFLAVHAAKVVTVDPDPWVHKEVWPSLHKRVKAVANRHDAQGVFDVVFIDANHTTADTRTDIEYAVSRIRQGLVLVHDAGIQEVADALDDSFHIVPTAHGIAIKYVGWGVT